MTGCLMGEFHLVELAVPPKLSLYLGQNSLISPFSSMTGTQGGQEDLLPKLDHCFIWQKGFTNRTLKGTISLTYAAEDLQ